MSDSLVGLESQELVVALLFVVVAIWPYVSANRNETSFALATVLSLMLVAFLQFSNSFFTGIPMQFDWPIGTFGIRPAIMDDPVESYRFLSSAWLHADWIHVLSNILVIALVGIPLEQRMGRKRWIAVYAIGFMGGNIAWVLSHPDSNVPAIGASGAAFGLLGAYMACWPDDEVEFPLLFLIRAWPIWVIVFVRLGLAVWQMYSIQSGTAGEGTVAHMAHVGGFFLAYSLARPIARGGPHSPDREDGTGSSTGARSFEMSRLDSDPWIESGKPLEGQAAKVLSRLREEGDEPETRRAWLEELSEHTICPLCDGEIVAIVSGLECHIECNTSSKHLNWP